MRNVTFCGAGVGGAVCVPPRAGIVVNWQAEKQPVLHLYRPGMHEISIIYISYHSARAPATIYDAQFDAGSFQDQRTPEFYYATWLTVYKGSRGLWMLGGNYTTEHGCEREVGDGDGRGGFI